MSTATSALVVFNTKVAADSRSYGWKNRLRQVRRSHDHSTMRDPGNVFHLAIPCRDLDEAAEFYAGRLQCRLARRYEDRITLDFFGDQLVCHLNPEKIDSDPEMYPRHFGVTFAERTDYDRVLALARRRKLRFFEEEFVRYAGQPEEHRAFFLIDPSNNLIEFKHYLNRAMMY